MSGYIDKDGDWVGGKIIKGDKIGGKIIHGNKVVVNDIDVGVTETAVTDEARVARGLGVLETAEKVEALRGQGKIQLPPYLLDTVDARFKRLCHADEFAEKLSAIKAKHGRDREAASSEMGDAVRELLTNLGYGEGVEILGSEWYG